MRERQSTILSVIFAFVIGGLLGASVALLMAPMSGSETRKRIMDKGGELKDKAADTMEDTRERASKAINEVADQTKKRASSLRDRGQETVNRVKSRS